MGTTAYDAACNADSPSHAFLLNEASGNPADSVGSITTTATSLSYGSASWLTGETAIGFNGSTSKIALSPAISTGTTFTIEMLLYPQAGNLYGSIGSQADVKGLYYQSSSAKVLDLYDGTTDHTNTTLFHESVWAVHAALVVSGGNGTFYINGVPDGTFTGFTGMSLDSIGNDPSNEAFKGLISRWRFYPTALTAAQIQSHFAALNTPAVNAVAALSPPATLDYSAASISASDGSFVTVLGDITGTVPAAVIGGTGVSAGKYYATAGVNSNPYVNINAGKIVIPYTGAIGSVAMLMKTNGAVWGANDAGNSSTGAAFCKFSSNNASAQIVTSSGGSDGAVNDGSSGIGMNCPLICICTFDDVNKVARLRINGYSFSASYVGTPKTSVALELFGNYTSGAPGIATGQFYRAAIWTSPLTTAQEASIENQLATIGFGPKPSRRFLNVGHNNTADTDTPCIAESNDATAWVNARQISYAPAMGDVRDVDFHFDTNSGTWYFPHTQYNFTNYGGTFGIAKSAGDLRLWVPHCYVNMTAVINPTTQNIWHPSFTPPLNGTLDSIICFLGNNPNPVYRVPINSLSGKSFGTIVAMTGAVSLDPLIVPPSSTGNPSSSLYRNYHGATEGGSASIAYQTASAKDGSYGSDTVIDNNTGHRTESPSILPMDDGSVRIYFWDPTALQSGYFVSADNGSTWSSTPTYTTGLTVASGNSYDHDGTPIDMDTISIVAAAVSPSSLALATANSNGITGTYVGKAPIGGTITYSNTSHTFTVFTASNGTWSAAYPIALMNVTGTMDVQLTDGTVTVDAGDVTITPDSLIPAALSASAFGIPVDLS